MSKDPAFLLYSQAFYESTRLMMPEERACFLDLLIYQHQNGEIPIDSSRMYLYCTGVTNEVVNQVLNEKFTKTETGWINKKMSSVVEDRKKSNPKKRAYSTLAGLLSSNSLTKTQAEKIKKEFNVEDFSDLPIDELKSKVKEWFYGVVNRFVNNNKDKDKDKSKDIIKAKDENKEEVGARKFDSADFKNILVDLGADEEHVEDWLVARKKKRASNTKTALKLFINECSKHSYPVHKAVKDCAENSWSGFRYEWVNNLKQNQSHGNQSNSNKQSGSTDFTKILSGIDAMYGDQ
jgi:hypothetical protein